MVRSGTYKRLFRPLTRRFSSFSQASSVLEEPCHTRAESGQIPSNLRFDFALFPLSPRDRRLLLGAADFNADASNQTLFKLLRSIRRDSFLSCVPLFFTVLYGGNIFRLSPEILLNLLERFSYSKPASKDAMSCEAVKWLLNIGCLNGGWRKVRFFEVALQVVIQHFPLYIPTFLERFVRLACLPEMWGFDFTRCLSGLIHVNSNLGLPINCRPLISDPSVAWKVKLSLVKALINTGHGRVVVDMLLDEPWLDTKARFLRLCRLILQLDGCTYGNAFKRLGKRIHQLSADEDRPLALVESYLRLTRTIFMFDSSLSLALDTFSAMVNDKVLPPWWYYTRLITKLRHTSYNAVKLIYRVFLSRCEGQLPSLVPSHSVSSRAVVSFTAFIQAASWYRDLEAVHQAYADLMRLQLPRDELLYLVLFTQLRHLGDFQNIYTIYYHLRWSAFPITNKLFACVIDGLERSPACRPMAQVVYAHALESGVQLSPECISVTMASLVRRAKYRKVVRMWCNMEDLFLEHLERRRLTPHFISLLFKSYARVVYDPFLCMQLWRKVKTQCPSFSFSAANFIVVLSHLIRLHYRPNAGPDPNFKWPTDLAPTSQAAELHFREVLSDLSTFLSSGGAVSKHELQHLRWFGATFPLLRKLLTDLEVKL